ncbi:hypothetical protein BC827DRAFT_1383744 [Russula dissimulans]|nr:hypothetical protein BC827DRAFT_1383744 [Russula dissimulans]
MTVVFLLLKQLSAELVAEAEVFLTLLIKLVGGETEAGELRPGWMRVLDGDHARRCPDSAVTPILGGVFGNATMPWPLAVTPTVPTGHISSRSLYPPSNALSLHARPSLLGVSAQMRGVGILHPSDLLPHIHGHSLDSVAGMVATAASLTVSNVVGMIGTEAGLSVQTAAMKVQCIDQLNKADAPPIPEAHTYLLGVEFLASFSDGFAGYAIPLYNTLAVQKPPSGSSEPVRAPGRLDLPTLPEAEPARVGLQSVLATLLAALSLFTTTLSDPLFGDVLGTLQALARAAGRTPPARRRRARRALPTPVTRPPVSLEGLTLGLAGGGGGGGPPQRPELSQLNLACLRALGAAAVFLAGTLGPSWFPAAMQRLFDASIMLDHSAFHDFVSALCKLSFEMVSMQSGADVGGGVTEGSREVEDNDIPSVSTSTTSLVTSRSERFWRRRVGGIHIPRTLRSGDFSIARLGGIAPLNIQRLVYRSPDAAWGCYHLTSSFHFPSPGGRQYREISWPSLVTPVIQELGGGDESCLKVFYCCRELIGQPEVVLTVIEDYMPYLAYIYSLPREVLPDSYNSLGENPCFIAAELESLCFGGEYVINRLQSGHSYFGPLYGESTSCQCNTVVYSLVSACGACQGSTWITWSQWSFNCSDLYGYSVTTYPNTIGTRVPHWAYLDVITAGTWNATAAEDAGDDPEVSPTSVSQTQASSVTASATFQSFSISSISSQASPFPSPHSNRNKVHAGQIRVVIIVVSVVGAAMLITVIFVCFRRRHRRAEELPSPSVGNETYVAEAGDLLLDSGPSMPLQYYDPSDPNTFPPQPIMFSPIPAAQTTQSGDENGHDTKSTSTNDRTKYSGLPLV